MNAQRPASRVPAPESASRQRWPRVSCADSSRSRRLAWGRVCWWVTGFAALVWFLVRVIPKPSRAAYPCQRAAAPVASGFVLWLMALVGTRLAWQRSREAARTNRRWAAAWCGILAVAGGAFTVSQLPMPSVQGGPDLTHGPIGKGRGIHPGRVVWVHAPEATDWAGYDSPTPWWLPQHTDLAVAEEMTATAIRSLAGEATEVAAWEALFRHFNAERGKGAAPYQPGEKIAIKINLTTCNARGNMANAQYEKNRTNDRNRWWNTIDNSPQMLVALLRQLVYEAGVAPGDISIGDPTGLFANHLWDPIHAEFPEVQCFDNHGKRGSGRVRTELSSVRFHWSSAAAQGKLPDYLPVPFAEAAYVINYAVLKGHSVGITVCAKNDYGSLLRCPDGYLRDQGKLDYFDIHNDLPGFAGAGGMGRYRPLVDLMGHRDLGGKTLLYLIDGLFGGYYWDSKPTPWKMPPFGDGVNGDWPNSLFVSQDPVAIDSVAYDFLLQEWPQVVNHRSLEGGAEDYLHEAALAQQPPSGAFYDPDGAGIGLRSLGVHEHWNNPIDKQYSRNLGRDEGIELVARTASRPVPQLGLTQRGADTVVSWRASLVGYRLEFTEQLGAETNWRPVPQPPESVEARNVVTRPAAAGRTFYRLAPVSQP